MTVSMRVMSAGDGFRYLLRTVAAGDGERSMSTPLTRYYSAKGTPPGRWMGSGLPGLGAGRIAEGDEVTESQLQLLIGMGRDPVTGEPLGRAYPMYEPGASRRRAVAGLRLHVLDSEVGERALGRCGCNDAGTHRARAPRCRCAGARVPGARGCGHAHRCNIPRRGRCAGRRHRRDRNGVRSLRQSGGRSAPAHARRDQQQGADRARRQVALARRPADARRGRRALRVARGAVRRRAHT